jgi:D-alanyl-D-alanine carboxypeptidase/D-alanyl-D-alanine-endopeptidase (penicillin-binding protein 4)
MTAGAHNQLPPGRSPPSGALVRAILALLACLAVSACATLQADQEVRRIFASPDLAGTRWGMMVVTLEGDTVFSLRPDDRFIPASNTKIFTTAAAFEHLPGIDLPDPSTGTSLRIVPGADGAPPDLILVGGGDATLSDREDCARNCLSSLAEIAMQNRIAVVRDVIGDDTLFPDERWGLGWSWNNLSTRSGTGVSALTVNDNELVLQVSPGAAPGDPAIAVWRDRDGFYPLVNDVVTISEGEVDIRVDILPGDQDVRVFGAIPAGAPSVNLTVGVHDPALVAAWRFRRRLEEAGIVVEGEIRALHRAPALHDDPALRGDVQPAAPTHAGMEIGRLLPPPLADDLRYSAKISQNLHTEILLRRLGLLDGAGSTADGLAVVSAMLERAGVTPQEAEIFDGSGMSTYNRISPRGMTRFLLWTTGRPWGEAWRATLPTGGVDGSLGRRFVDTPLEGAVFAKTGTLNATNALAGFFTAASGQTLAFAAYANDRPSDAGSAIIALDAALLAIAAAH